eukprot:PhM_4_TR11631/c3_g2_i2/m.6243
MDLTADQTWTQIRDLKVGDKVVAKYRWGGDAEVHEEEVEVVKEASKTSRSSAKDYAVVRRKCNQKIRFPQDGSNDTDIVAYVSIVKKAGPQFKSVCFDPDDDDDICLVMKGATQKIESIARSSTTMSVTTSMYLDGLCFCTLTGMQIV